MGVLKKIDKLLFSFFHNDKLFWVVWIICCFIVELSTLIPSKEWGETHKGFYTLVGLLIGLLWLVLVGQISFKRAEAEIERNRYKNIADMIGEMWIWHKTNAFIRVPDEFAEESLKEATTVSVKEKE